MDKIRLIRDRFYSYLVKGLTFFSCFILIFIGISLFIRSGPILADQPLWKLFLSTSWHPLKGEFGFLPFIIGTLLVTGLAVVIATPLSLLTAIFLSEYAHGLVLKLIKPLIDLLAGIPSVVFGLWGILVIVPIIKDFIAPLFGTFSSGYSTLAGGIVLAIMIIPVMCHVAIEVLQSISRDLREAALSVGATKWQTIKHVVLRKALPGIVAAIVLGLSRAFGETMAVMMVCGNVAQIPTSLLEPSYPLPALIANNYGEMLSIPLYDSALLLASFILFIIVLVFNTVSRIILNKLERSIC
jgi:phosphate transport system permease protein